MFHVQYNYSNYFMTMTYDPEKYMLFHIRISYMFFKNFFNP